MNHFLTLYCVPIDNKNFTHRFFVPELASSLFDNAVKTLCRVCLFAYQSLVVHFFCFLLHSSICASIVFSLILPNRFQFQAICRIGRQCAVFLPIAVFQALFCKEKFCCGAIFGVRRRSQINSRIQTKLQSFSKEILKL